MDDVAERIVRIEKDKAKEYNIIFRAESEIRDARYRLGLLEDKLRRIEQAQQGREG